MDPVIRRGDNRGKDGMTIEVRAVMLVSIVTPSNDGVHVCPSH